jgi:hypothetical protein
MYTSKLYVVMWLRKIVLICYRIPSLLYASNITIIYQVKFFGLDLVVFDLPDSSSTRGVLRATPPDKPKRCMYVANRLTYSLVLFWMDLFPNVNLFLTTPLIVISLFGCRVATLTM